MFKLPKISLLFLSNILGKKWVIKVIFCMQISMKVSYRLIVWFLMGMVKHTQSSQNSKFAMSLQYLQKEVRYEVDFFAKRWTSKFPTSWLQHFGHQSFLQEDTIIIDGHDQAFSKYSKWQVCNISKKKLGNGVQSFYNQSF